MLEPLSVTSFLLGPFCRGGQYYMSNFCDYHDLIPTSLLLQLEAGRNFETFIARTSGLKTFSSTDLWLCDYHNCAIIDTVCNLLLTSVDYGLGAQWSFNSKNHHLSPYLTVLELFTIELLVPVPKLSVFWKLAMIKFHLWILTQGRISLRLVPLENTGVY